MNLIFYLNKFKKDVHVCSESVCLLTPSFLSSAADLRRELDAEWIFLLLLCNYLNSDESLNLFQTMLP